MSGHELFIDLITDLPPRADLDAFLPGPFAHVTVRVTAQARHRVGRAPGPARLLHALRLLEIRREHLDRLLQFLEVLITEIDGVGRLGDLEITLGDVLSVMTVEIIYRDDPGCH